MSRREMSRKAVLDPAVVERAIASDKTRRLTQAERHEIVARMTSWGVSASMISARTGISARHVVRIRTRLGVHRPQDVREEAS